MRRLYQSVDALSMTIAPTPPGVSGKYYDKIEQQPEVLCSTFAIRGSGQLLYEQGGSNTIRSLPSLLYSDIWVYR
jgi:hypothetical protein